MLNPMKLMKLKKAWETFTGNHPKFPKFIEAIQNKGLQEGTVIEIIVTTPAGENIGSNVKLTASDMALLSELKDLSM
ncbi:hypothetical protein [Clostridium sp. KNHs205]|jgi:hypothetical protein|uniref:hypothetical protein n=1 Tax=Clostridium sp. KNHs205 TaxID=1449050 RepID=UPI00068D685D|nr:hypothetical protein [Clostridium sp. KNHs205]